jgi:lysophospholipase L1-like esterase
MACFNKETVVAVLGHSYVRRLGEWTTGGGDNGRCDFGSVRDEAVSGYCFGVGGGTARSGGKCVMNRLSDVATVEPSVVFLHIGENDLSAMDATELTCLIMKHANEIVDTLKVPKVVIGQLLDFPANAAHTEKVLQVNWVLGNAVDGERVHLWRHRCGFWGADRNVFHADGVHLNAVGMERYYHSVRRGICHVLRRH